MTPHRQMKKFKGATKKANKIGIDTGFGFYFRALVQKGYGAILFSELRRILYKILPHAVLLSGSSRFSLDETVFLKSQS